jgi:hypothetical protein
MSLAKGTKARGNAFHLILTHSTGLMSFKAELCDYFCTTTTSSPCMLRQGHAWLCFLRVLWPNTSDPNPVTRHTTCLMPTTNNPTNGPLTPTAPGPTHSLPDHHTQEAGSWRGRGLRGRAYAVQPIRKDLVVMSQWAHSPWNLESPETAPAWPVAMAAQPAKQEEAGGRCPCVVWKTSHLSGA